MLLANAVLSALVSLLVFAGLPFFVYFAYQNGATTVRSERFRAGQDFNLAQAGTLPYKEGASSHIACNA
jgi:hypothetical protein